MAIVKCRNCGKQIDRDLAIAISAKRYVCSEECKDELIKKDNSKIAKPKSNIKNKEKQQILDYVKSITNNSIDVKLEAIKLSKMLKNNSSFTLSGIKYTLWYIANIEHKKISGIGIVPYYYEKARKYYQWKSRMKKEVLSNNNIECNEIVIVRKNKYLDEDIFD